jgi:hypothetical protein
VRDGSTAQATVTVLNAYDSDFPWPSGSRIAGLRIIQLLPKTTPQRDNPRIGVASGANARAVLGTVPVESDGSAHFLAPAGKALYFQALDERGLAIQSMRSATYLQPGERLSCQGCHESKRQAPRNRSGPPPVALSRPPSVITPEPEGSKPFSYVRLVQPVLDKHCVTCHQQRKGPDLSGALTSPTFSASYLTLTGKTTKVSKGKRMDLAFKYDSSGSSGNPRSVAGALGARGSGLFMLLEAGHQKVQLPPEDFRRITLWLDCNSDFYGSYDKIEEQRQGKIVIPELE